MVFEALKRTGQDPRNEGEVQQFAIKNALRTLSDGGVVDPGAEVIIAALSRHLESTEQIAIEPLRFSQEARESLAAADYRIYTLTGQSIRTLKEAGRQFWSSWHNDYPHFEALSSQQSEVAIPADPKNLFLHESNNKTLEEQEEMVKNFSQELGKKISGVQAIIGEVPDYIELAFQHLDATSKEENEDNLFGEKYARTKTPTVGSFVAYIGSFGAGRLGVGRWDRGDGDGNVFVAPLVVPAETKK